MRMPHQRDLDALPCYVTVQDRALRVVAANTRFVEAFGPIEDRRCYQIYKRRSAPCERCPVERTFRDGGCHDCDEHVWNLQGRNTAMLVFTAPIHDARGRITNVMEMCGEVTPIRELQSQLASLGLLIGSVSHSIKGLLPGLDGGIHLVGSGLAQDDLRRVARGWEMIGRSVTRIRSLVLDMLYYAKDREPFLHEVPVTSVIEEARDRGGGARARARRGPALRGRRGDGPVPGRSEGPARPRRDPARERRRRVPRRHAPHRRQGHPPRVRRRGHRAHRGGLRRREHVPRASARPSSSRPRSGPATSASTCSSPTRSPARTADASTSGGAAARAPASAPRSRAGRRSPPRDARPDRPSAGPAGASRSTRPAAARPDAQAL